MPGIEDLEPGTAMASWVAAPGANGIATSFLPHTISVGADSSPARLRRSCSGVAKLRHSPVPVRTPSGVLAPRDRTLDDLAVAVGLCLHVAADEQGSGPAEHRRRAEHAAELRDNGFNGTNPPVLTRTRPATDSDG